MNVPYANVDVSRLLVDGMKVARENHRMIANNIANADTPNYNPRELNFQATLRNSIENRGRISLRETLPQHFGKTVHSRSEMERLAILSKNDYNKVDLDDQMTKLSENTGKYNIYASLLVKKFEMTKNMLTALR